MNTFQMILNKVKEAEKEKPKEILSEETYYEEY